MPWQPGESGNPAGRVKGALEHNTRILREAVILAAERAGGGSKDGLVNYLHAQALAHPVAFLNILGKVLPLQIKTEGASNVTVQIVKRFEEVTVTKQEPLTIEHQTNGHGANGSSSK